MIPGITFLGEYPLGVLPLAYNRSTPAIFDLLFNQPDVDFLFLVEIHPFVRAKRTLLGLPAPLGLDAWNAATTFDVYDDEADIYLSDRGYRTTPSDPTLPNADFKPRLAKSFTLSAVAFSGFDPSSGASTRGSEIEVISEDGEFDAWARMGFADREIKVLAGVNAFAYRDFGVVAKWHAAGLDMKEGLITINPKDRASIFDRSVQENLYAGTGGKEGGADLAGTPKPLAYGLCRAVEGRLVDATIYTYQLHDGAIAGVLAAKDKGVALTLDADYPDYASLAAATLAGGYYATCVAEGFGRVGGTPAGRVTWDLQGENTGGYVSTGAAVLRRIVTTRLGAQCLSDPEDLDASAFAAVDAANPGAVGLFIANDRKVSDVLSDLQRSFFGFWYFTRAGLLSVGMLGAAGVSVATVSDSTIGDAGPEQLEPDSPPSWRILVGYQKVWTVQSGVDLAGSVTAADRSLLGQEYRYSVYEDTSIKARHWGSQPVTWPTLLDAKSDADALAARIGAFMAGDPRRVRFPLLRSQLRYWLGDTLTFSTDKIGLGGGFVGIVAAIDENYQNGETVVEVVG